MPSIESGPVLIAYDGSDLAKFAIEHAATQLAPGREAIVLCVWQPADVGFTPVPQRHFDADDALAVHKCAEETATFGASLATQAGFRARSMVVEESPIWKGIIHTAESENASLIVLGSHHRHGIVGHLLGSVASAVVAHSTTSVLVAHKH